jgi:hypothetical protein
MIFAEMSEDMPIEALNVSLNYVPLESTQLKSLHEEYRLAIY